MQFEKYFYGDREIVVFVDEAGDPTLNDPNNPIFAFAACAVFGADLANLVRDPWRALRRKVTGSDERRLHMRTMGHRLSEAKIGLINDFFESAQFRRFSFAITDRTIFENDILPKTPILELCLEHTLMTVAELMSGPIPAEAVSFVFEDGPFIEKIRPHWQSRQLVRNDGVKVSVNWAILSKGTDEPGLEIADYIAHSTAGFMRDEKSTTSKFSNRYHSIFPAHSPGLCRGLELNKAEFKSASQVTK